MDRKMIDYLPMFIQEYAEIKAIIDAEQVEVLKTWTDAEKAMRDQFIYDATENGVKRWETILKIIPKATYTLDDRKFNILARLNEQLPFTMEKLRVILSAMCGKDGYTVTMNSDKYILAVKLSLSNENNVEAVKNLLKRMVPANIVIAVSLFDTHAGLTKFTHEQLALCTHMELRREDI